jgi:hypothetical protein
MIRCGIRAWSAWAPGLATNDDWLQWAGSPSAPDVQGAPELKFVPAMVRRRFSRLSKMALQVAFDATPPELLADVGSVFASRHGEASACLLLLADIARGTPLSPTAFSHSVHNTQSGLFSITAGNGRAASAIAGGRHTFCAGLVEALGLCERHPGQPTLLVVADEPIPEAFRGFADEESCSYALALLIEPEGGASTGFELDFAVAAPPAANAPRLPQALEFLAWMLAGREALVLPFGSRGVRFTRAE